MGGFAWVTLATNDSYSLGALVLAHSLKQVGTRQQLVVLVTPGVTNSMKQKLQSVFDLVQEVNILDSKDETNLKLLKRPELGVTFTKLHCWRLTQFDKCVFLDADTLVLQNCDELFEREELSAAPDVGWPDCFNSGVFVYKPSTETYEKLIQLALEKGSFDGGDQGLLNMFFADWATKDISKHLPFIYNLCSTACYSYLPAFKQFGANAKIIHFIGSSKPWLQYFNTETRKVQPSPEVKHLEVVLQRWWDIFCNLIHSSLTPDMAPSSSDVTHTNLSYYQYQDPPSPNSPTVEIWDPWEEYDQRHSFPAPTSPVHVSATEPQMQPIESHNTNACTASRQYSPPPPSPSPSPPPPPPTPADPPQPVPSTPAYDTTEPPWGIPIPESSPETHDPITTDPPLVPPSECEAPATVCNETTLHTPPLEDESSNAGLAGAFAQLTLGAPRTAEQSALDDHLRRQGWEVGNIDYLGRDSFDNIWSKICETLQTAVAAAEPPKPKEPTPPASEVKPSEKTALEAPQETPKPTSEVPTPASPVPQQQQQQQPEPEVPQQCPLKAAETPQTEPSICPLPPKTQETVPEPTTTTPALQQQPPSPQPIQEQPAVPQSPKPAEPATPTEPVPPESPKAAEPALKPATPTQETVPPVAPKEPVPPESPKAAEPAPACPLKPATPTQETAPLVAPKEPVPAESPKAAEPALKPATPTQEAAPPVAPKEPAPPESPKAAEPVPTCPAKPATPKEPVPPESPKAAEPAPTCPIKPATPTQVPSSPQPEPAPAVCPIKPATPTQETAPVPPAPQPPVPESPKPTPGKGEPEPAKQEQASEPGTGGASSVASPTPPPRKGSGGGKKASKSKK